MPEPHRPTERTAAERQADHAGLARLSETLVPALVAKLGGSGLGEVEIREGDWKVRLRRPVTASAGHRRPEWARQAPAGQERRDPAPRAATGSSGSTIAAVSAAGTTVMAATADDDAARAIATSPAVGLFRPVTPVGGTVRQGDRIAVVDLLGIPQDVVAPVDGVLVEVFVEAGDAVEYGEEVAAIEPPPAALADAPQDREG